jgi:exonuclease VII small subunit
MKTENIPANIKSKSLKEAKDEINQILEKLESKNLDLDNAQDDYIRLIQLNTHIENLFKKKSRDILNTK